jgi:branched-chain amino acid transport system substrate-binding protein
MKDFSAVIGKFKKEGVQIVCGTVIPPDFITFWRQSHQQGFFPKMATIGKAILFPADVGALGGNLPQGLLAENWWSPFHPFKSSLDRRKRQRPIATPGPRPPKTLDRAHRLQIRWFEIAADALKRAGTVEKKALLKAIGETDMNTIVGPHQIQ